MSIRALKDFWSKIDEDPDFQKQFFETTPSQVSDPTAVVEFARQLGFEFTEEELSRAADAAAGKGGLKDDELAGVVGGVAVVDGMEGMRFASLDTRASKTSQAVMANLAKPRR
jgi:predicted ribosomally synthesized peptide with nif11-like leader